MPLYKAVRPFTLKIYVATAIIQTTKMYARKDSLWYLDEIGLLSSLLLKSHQHTLKPYITGYEPAHIQVHLHQWQLYAYV
jgi:hypothetical protein